MFRRYLLAVGLISAVLTTGFIEGGCSRSAQEHGRNSPQVEQVRNTVLAQTGYRPDTLELSATAAQITVTVVQGPSDGRTATEREAAAKGIVNAVASAIAGKPNFHDLHTIHIDFVARSADGQHRQTIDALDFRKDQQGLFVHHLS